jgi:hypothetical protein
MNVAPCNCMPLMRDPMSLALRNGPCNQILISCREFINAVPRPVSIRKSHMQAHRLLERGSLRVKPHLASS